ncbi:TraR/DksA family transcriptional regulator [Pseudomonas aeruginosa]
MTPQDILAMPADAYMNEIQREFFRQVLLEKHGAAKDAIEQARDALANLGNAADPADQATIEEDRQKLTRTLDRLQGQVDDIRSALKAIDDGEYGWCESTGEEIGLRRLLAQPTARYSAIAQSLQESISRHFAAA